MKRQKKYLVWRIVICYPNGPVKAYRKCWRTNYPEDIRRFIKNMHPDLKVRLYYTEF